MQEFTFSINDVLTYLNVPHRGPVKNTEDVTCPQCNGKKKLHIVYSKNLAHCNKCGCGGGMIPFAAQLLGVDNREAAKILDAYVNGDKSYEARETRRVEQREIVKKAEKEAANKAPLASVESRNAIYTAFLEELCLSGNHKSNLVKRGLTDNQIAAYGYKSVPAFGRETLPGILESKGHDCSGVPLFYKDRKSGKSLVNVGYHEGFYIPIRDLFGNIIGMQIRLDDKADANPEKKQLRYIYATSWSDSLSLYQGCNLEGVPKLHHRGFETGLQSGKIPTVAITEGPLKADVAFALGFKTPFIALCGLGNQNGLQEELRMLQERYGLNKVLDLSDMDKFDVRDDGRENAVWMHSERICNKARELGLTVERYRWSRELKGIDDYMLFLKRKKEKATATLGLTPICIGDTIGA